MYLITRCCTDIEVVCILHDTGRICSSSFIVNIGQNVGNTDEGFPFSLLEGHNSR
jgi:hypothetical protein